MRDGRPPGTFACGQETPPTNPRPRRDVLRVRCWQSTVREGYDASPIMATIEGHPDFGVLEQRLVDLIRTIRETDRSGPFAPVAIVAPTGRLLAHLRQVLAGSLPALLNVRFLHHDALLREVAAGAEIDLPRPIADHVRQALLAQLAAEGGGALAEYVALRPGSAAALRRTMDDLREAGVEASPRPAGLSRSGAEMMRLYARYAASLDRLSRHRLGDRAARARAALPHVAPFARRFKLVVHYGAYDLIGVNLDVLRAVDASGVPLTFLVPFHPTSPAYQHARRFWPVAFDAMPVLLPDHPAAQRRLGGRLADLYDEEAPPAEGASPMFHTQGAPAELREAALRVLALHRDRGIPLRRIAIIARSLEPYAPHLVDLLPRFGLPFVTSAARGALREGVVQAALQLARVVLGDYERQPLMDLLRGGHLQPGDREVWRDAQAWDRLSRDYRVARGFATWTRDLPESVGRMEAGDRDSDDEEARLRREAFVELRLGQAKALAAMVTRLQRAALPVGRARSWREWSQALMALCRNQLRAFRQTEGDRLDPGAELVAAILHDMEDLDAVGVPFSRPAALSHFQRTLAGQSIAIGAVEADGSSGAGDNGGVRVLDTMQARGLGFEAVFLIGFNAGLFPRRPRPDPLLDDGDRAALREPTGRPLPLASEAREEEHLLLAHMLGAAGTDLTVSWQRADESGVARVPSLALREIGRLTIGAADLGLIAERAERIPTHPLEFGRRAVERWGLLPATEARINAALQLADPRRLRQALPALPAGVAADHSLIEAGLTMLGIVEDFSARDLRFDACVGDAAPPPATWSPSRLERLGVCPQQYFFRHALHIDELLEPSAGPEVPLVDLGRHVHHVLQIVYRSLLDEGALRAAGADPVRRAEAILEQVWERESTGIAALAGARYPLLWEAMTRQWVDALRAFLRADLADLIATGGEVVALEQEVNARLTLGPPGTTIDMHGRFDRIRRTASGELVISDYKTSGNPHDHVGLAEVLKGRRLQMPLYLLMAEARLAGENDPEPAVRAEILGVGPAFTLDASTWDEEAGRAVLDPEKFALHRDAFGETLAVLVDLAAAGFFPLNDQHARICAYCPFVRACRRGQAPAAARLEAARAGRDYFLLQKKSTKAPFLPRPRDGAGRGTTS